MSNTTLILDLDGVLITTGAWKPDAIDVDGYSEFDYVAVQNFNKLLKDNKFEIWLSSSRRIYKSLEEMNAIFKHRGIVQPITGFLPYLPALENRKKEVEHFIKVQKLQRYLILDDDKTLNALPPIMKAKLVLTKFLIGFKEEKLAEAFSILAQYD